MGLGLTVLRFSKVAFRDPCCTDRIEHAVEDTKRFSIETIRGKCREFYALLV
jgi:hypothetical protein